MKVKQQNGPQYHCLTIESENADDNEASFQFESGKKYIRNFVVIVATKHGKSVMCTMESSLDGKNWEKGCPEKLSGTLHIRMTDGGDDRQIVIYMVEEHDRDAVLEFPGRGI